VSVALQLEGAKGLLKTVGFKMTTHGVRQTSTHDRMEWVPDWESSDAEVMEAKIVWTLGTDNRLVLEEHKGRAGMWKL